MLSRLQTFYGCEEGYEEDAAKVIETECRRLIHIFRHEARVQAVRDYYATRLIRKHKAKCRDSKMEKEHYMKVITCFEVSFLDLVLTRSNFSLLT